jgi:hypothetical protein
VAVVQVPILQVFCDEDVAEKEPPEMNPYLVLPVLEKDIVYAHEGVIVTEVVVPVLPVVGEAEQPLTV